MVRGKDSFVQSNRNHYREEARAELQMLVVDGASESSDTVVERSRAPEDPQRSEEGDEHNRIDGSAHPDEGEARQTWQLDAVSLASYQPQEDDNMSNNSGEQTLRQRKNSDIVSFYERQREALRHFEEAEQVNSGVDISAERKRASEDADIKERVAIWLSLAVNLGLFLAKSSLAFTSGSLALVASTLDSFLDLLSGVILYCTSLWESSRTDYYFPIGKARMQPLGIVMFSSIMATMGSGLIYEAIRQLAGDEHIHHFEHHTKVIAVMVVAMSLKLILYLHLLTYSSDHMQSVAQDHRNDVLTNGLGLLAAVAGDRSELWMLDLWGAILLAAFITYSWFSIAVTQARLLAGQAAPPEVVQKIIYLCWNHHQDITAIDTVRAYTFGKKYFAEIDIVLSATMPLKRAHDIGESLQDKVEKFPEIERAFVHLDYESSHRPEHRRE